MNAGTMIGPNLNAMRPDKNRFTCNVIIGLTFEKNRWQYLLALPVYWLLILWVMAKKKICDLLGRVRPATNTLWMDGLGSEMMQIRKGAASWKALNLIYNHRFGEKKTLGGLIDDFWIGMINAQAVRNRFKMVKREVRQELLSFRHEPEVRIISLACGSAQAILEVIAEFKKAGVLVRALLVDIDQTAIDYASRLAQELDVADRVETRKMNVFRASRLVRDFNPHVVEMLGLLDYLNRDQAIWLIGGIYRELMPDGLFLTCNIAPNPERAFLKWVIDWEMVYRRPEDLVDVIASSGFADYRLIYEPLNVHGIVAARK